VLGGLARSWHVKRDGTRRLNKEAGEGGKLTLSDVIRWCDGPKFSPIETWFFRREVFEHLGGLDLRYRICPDLDLAFRIVKAGLHFTVAPECILEKCFYEDGSNLVANLPRLIRERREVVWRHTGWTSAGLRFLYSYPVPLHVRLARWPALAFWKCWLTAVKALQRGSPSTYAFLQGILARKPRA
jgi:GT2 family glycosyltransferase